MSQASTLRELRSRYIADLPRKLGDLGSILDRLESTPADRAAIAELAASLHKLRGSSGSYGFDQLSVLAGQWEDSLNSVQGLGLALDSGAVQHMRPLLQSLRKAAYEGCAACEPPADRTVQSLKSGLRVLLVEDDPDMTALLGALLGQVGLRVETAGDVDSALSLFRDDRYDLIITDYFVPGGNAKRLAEEVRRMDPHVPILLISGRAEKGELAAMFRQAVDDFIQKPVDASALLAAVRRLTALGQERMRMRDRAALFLEAASKIAPDSDIEAAFRAFVEIIPKVTPLGWIELVSWPEMGGDAVMVASATSLVGTSTTRRPSSSKEAARAVSCGHGLGQARFITARDLAEGGPVRAYDQALVRQIPWQEGDLVLAELGTSSKVFGYLFAGSPSDGFRPSEDTMLMVSLLAQQVSGVLQNLETHHTETRMIRNLEASADVMKVALGASDLDTVFQLTSQLAVSTFNNSFACILHALPNIAGYFVMFPCFHEQTEKTPSTQLSPTAEAELRLAAKHGTPLFKTADEGESASLFGHPECRCSMALPIVSGQSFEGFVVIEDNRRARFDMADISVALSCCEQISLMCSNIRYRDSLELADADLRASYQTLQATSEKNLRLQEIIRRYLPASTWDSAERASDGKEVPYIESLVERPIMFVDIVGFTSLTESSSPIYIVELLNLYFPYLSALIARRGGELIKFIGDGVMAHFDDAAGAIRAADEIITGRSALNKQLAAAGIGGINFRVGVAWGPAILCHVGPLHFKDRTLLGDTVNTAARLESAAAPGTALLDQRLLANAHPEGFGLALLEKHISLKGKNKRIAVMTFQRDAHFYS